MDYSCQLTEISKISLDDETFRVSTKGLTNKTLEPLAASIARLGLIHPPNLIASNSGYRVLFGFSRIKVCRDLGWERIPSHCLDSGTGEAQCALWTIAEAVSQQSFNIVEQSNSAYLLEKIFSNREDSLEAAETVGFKLNTQLLDKLLQVHDLDRQLKLGLIEGSIGLPAALRIESLAGKSHVRCLAVFIQEMNVSLSRQKELLDYIESICRRDDITIPELLSDPQIEELRIDSEIDGPQKSRRIRDLLKKRCFPTITAFEKHYQDAMKKVHFGNGVELFSPPNFEGRTFSLRIAFSSHEEFVQRAMKVNDLIQSAAFQYLLDPQYQLKE